MVLKRVERLEIGGKLIHSSGKELSGLLRNAKQDKECVEMSSSKMQYIDFEKALFEVDQVEYEASITFIDPVPEVYFTERRNIGLYFNNEAMNFNKKQFLSNHTTLALKRIKKEKECKKVICISYYGPDCIPFVLIWKMVYFAAPREVKSGLEWKGVRGDVCFGFEEDFIAGEEQEMAEEEMVKEFDKFTLDKNVLNYFKKKQDSIVLEINQ
jgi:hypothetical protein